MKNKLVFQILESDYYINSNSFPLKSHDQDPNEYNHPRVSTIYTYNNEKFTGLVISDGNPEADDYEGEVFYQFEDGSLIISYSRTRPFFKYVKYGGFHTFIQRFDEIIVTDDLYTKIKIGKKIVPLDWDELSIIERINFQLSQYTTKVRSRIFLSWVTIKELIHCGYIIFVIIENRWSRYLQNEIDINNFIQLLSDNEVNERHNFSAEHGCLFDFEINSISREKFENSKILQVMVSGSIDLYEPNEYDPDNI
jgi:hypothetical protein